MDISAGTASASGAGAGAASSTSIAHETAIMFAPKWRVVSFGVARVGVLE
jgi:hypothetical protein